MTRDRWPGASQRGPETCPRSMSTRNAYRRHSARFKLQVCQDIREGVRSRSESIREFKLSNALIQQWMTKFDEGLLDGSEDEAPQINDYEAHIAALERKVGQLTMALDLLRKATSLRQSAPPAEESPIHPGETRHAKGGAAAAPIPAINDDRPS
jgi:transposase